MLSSWKSVQSSHSVVSDSLQPHEPQHAWPPCPSPTPGPPKPMSIESVMPSKHPILCRPLLLLPSIFPSIRVFSNESALHIRWPKYWSFSFNISSSNEHPGLISCRMDWLDLLAVQGTLKSFLQHHSSKASVLQRSAFFTVQLSHLYMTTGKTIALTFVGKTVSLLLNMLSRLVITFLPRCKRLLIPWLQSPSAMILESRKTKSATVSPSICHEVMGPDTMILVYCKIDSEKQRVVLGKNLREPRRSQAETPVVFHKELGAEFQKNALSSPSIWVSGSLWWKGLQLEGHLLRALKPFLHGTPVLNVVLWLLGWLCVARSRTELP